MTNKASNQQDDIWDVIAKGLVEAVKMVFSAFTCIFVSSAQNKDEDEPDSGYRSGSAGSGCYIGNTRIDDEK
ncbi:hypothetical protein [Serratia aquatilis]|uniref:Uncharacterized protein n=1 Tax=Serratia aquatilis TaxID=1737515 RepID=A0ABV6EFZ3_9GAMM